MLKITALKRVLAYFLALLIPFISVGCGKIASDPTTSWKTAATSFNTANSNFNQEMQTTLTGVHDLVSIATNDYTYSKISEVPTSELAAVTLTASFDATLAVLATSSAKALVYAKQMSDNAKTFYSAVSSESSAASSFFITKQLPPPNGEMRAQFVFVLAIVAGVALTGYLAANSVSNSINTTRSAPSQTIIGNATGADLQAINTALGLPANATNAQALTAFNNLGTNARLNAIREIEDVGRAGGITGVGQIGTSVANTAVQVGQTGVTTYVGLATTATGGQGAAQLTQAVTGSEIVGVAVDLGLSAAGAQPLDILANSVNINTTSSNTSTGTVAAPTDPSVSGDDAINTLNNAGSATPGDLDNAVNVVGTQLANDNEGSLGTTTNPDGTLSVNVPDQVNLVTVDNPQSGQTVALGGQATNMGNSTVLVGPDGSLPEVVSGVNLNNEPDIGIENIDINDATASDIEAPTEGNYSLSIIVTPGDPSPGQSVLVTATINPIKADVPIKLSIVGTDGYSKTNNKTTDSSGQATMTIPGAASGVTDVVTVTLTDQGLTKTYTYVF